MYHADSNIPSSVEVMSNNEIEFENCDVDAYYRDQKDLAWRWTREEISSLLLRTHRQAIPFTASSEFLFGESDGVWDASWRKYATNMNTRDVLADLDRGKPFDSEDVDIDTVYMILTQTEIPVADEVLAGWEPGFLWPVDTFKFSVSNATDDYSEEHHEELFAALHDLHNIRPKYVNSYHSHSNNSWYFSSCSQCEVGNDKMIKQTSSHANEKWMGINFDLDDSNHTSSQKGGGNTSCICPGEHAMQPPKHSRGEIARTLLYMNLRYGTLTETNSMSYLDLALTDCHPNDRAHSDNMPMMKGKYMGYFSRLVQWHRDNPPSQREIDRNDKICRKYQGNRNPFVDFYEESWVLLDFDRVERESCDGERNDSSQGGGDDDYYDDDYLVSTEARTSNSFAPVGSGSGNMDDSYGCNDLIPGDVSFFMVQPAAAYDETTDINQYDEWQQQSFGLVALVNLKPGLSLYVAGVDDGTEDFAHAAKLEKNLDYGILKFNVPQNGLPIGSYFGYGERIYLGDQWQLIADDIDNEKNRFSIHQLYLYCVEEDENESLSVKYKVLAALSTTGRSFGQNGMPSYWENLKRKYSDVVVKENFNNGIHYGLIILPEDASDSKSSGGYRYVGPTYTKYDQYAKALVDEANWIPINRLDDSDGPYGRMGDIQDIDSVVTSADRGELNNEFDRSAAGHTFSFRFHKLFACQSTSILLVMWAVSA